MTQRPEDEPPYGTPPVQGEPPVYGSPAHGRPGPGQRPGPPSPLHGGVQEEQQWALFAHLGGVLAIFPIIHLLPALLIFAIYGSRSEFVKDQAREALNFQLVVLIAYFAARILNVIPLFPNLVVLVWLFSLIFSVVGAVTASKGTRYRYPITYRFLT
jgi:uncharacterized Tic20 family protein